MLSEEKLRSLTIEYQDAGTVQLARAIEAAVLEEQAKAEPAAYKQCSACAQYAESLHCSRCSPLYLHPSPAPEGMVLVPIACLRSLQSSINGNCYMGQEWEIAQIDAMISAAEKDAWK